jgi:outer membrane protein insertion porin family
MASCRLPFWVRVGALLLALVLPALSPARGDELDYGLAERRVARIRFVGNRAFEDGQLEELLPFHEPKWYAPFRSARYRTDELRVGVRAVEDFYRRQGYHAARVELDRVVESDAFGDEVVFTVEEGPYTSVKAVDIVNAGPVPESELRKHLIYHAGAPAPYSESQLGRDVYRLFNMYVARGYLSARIGRSMTRNDSLVTIRYDIDPGPVYTIGTIRIEGTMNTRESHVRRELRIEPGDRFDPEKIALTEADLLDLGWFRDVSFVPTSLDTARAVADLSLRLVERPTGFTEFGVGVGDEERVRLAAGWGNKNFRRSGRSLQANGKLLWRQENRFDRPDERKLVLDHEEEVAYRNPRFLGTRFNLGLSFFFRQETRGESGVIIESGGLVANTPISTGRYTTVEVEAANLRVLKRPIEGIELPSTVPSETRATTRGLSLVVTRDFRDNIFNPRHGSTRQFLVQTAGGPVLGGDNSFNRLLASWAHYRALPARTTLALRAQAGWAGAWWHSKDTGVPLENRYFAGGSSSVRGYRQNSLGPRVTFQDSLSASDPRFLANRPTSGGNALLLLNAEMRFPIPLLSRWGLSGALFFDGGNVWEDWGKVQLSQFRLTSEMEGSDPTTILDFRTSVGWSIHYNTPVGPLRLDYGLPLKRARLVDAEGNVQIDPQHIWHFSLGHTF